MWIAAVRSDALWADDGARGEALRNFGEAVEETLKLALYVESH